MTEVTGFHTVPPTPAAASSPSLDVRNRLASTRDQKIARFGEKHGYGPNDRKSDTFVEIDGFNESMHNKITNDYTPAELDAIAADLNRRFGVQVNSSGVFRTDEQGNEVPYDGAIGKLASFYEYGTQDGGTKIGTWGGYDPSERYSESYLTRQKENIGARGVNKEDLRRHYILPVEQVDLLEGLYHGNATFLQNRALRQNTQRDPESIAAYNASRAEFGTGASEIYNTFDRGSVDPENTAALFAAFNERYRPETGGQLTNEEKLQRVRDQINKQDVKEGVGFFNRAVNAAAGIAPTVVSQLFVEPAVTVAEMAGYTPESTANERNAYLYNALGYNPEFANDAVERTQAEVKRVLDAMDEGHTPEFSDVWNIVKEAGSSGELLTTSLASVGAMMVGVGKFTKIGKAVSDVEKARKAGNISSEIAKQQINDIKSASSILEKVSHLAAGQVGFIATVIGDSNNRLDRFAENNGGEWDAGDLIRTVGFSAAIHAIDRYSAQLAIGGTKALDGVLDNAAINSIKTIVDELPANAYVDFVKATTGNLAKISAGVATEGTAEYVQTLADLVSVQYATEKYGDDVGAIVADEQNQLEALTGAALGAVMGGQMSAGGIATRAGIDLANRVPKLTGRSRIPEEAPVETDPAEEAEIISDRTVYNQTLTRLRDKHAAGELKAESLADHISDLEELRRTRSSVSDANPEALAAADKALADIETRLAELVLANPEGNLVLNRIVTSEPRTLPRQQVGTDAESSTNVNAQAFREQADNLNLTERIEEEFAKGSTANEVRTALDSELTSIPLEERSDFIASVRATLGIPSRSTEEGKAEFDQWVAERNSTLGSRPLSEAEQRTLTESAIDIVAAQKKGVLTEQETETLNKFAAANGVTPAKVYQIIKSHADVETEATVGHRGILGRGRALDRMLADSKPNGNRIKKSYGEAASWMGTTLESIQELEAGIRAAEERVATENNSARKSTAPITVTTGYKKLGSTEKNPNYFEIQITHDGKEYKADLKQARARIKDKQRTAVGLNNLLKRFEKEAGQFLSSDTVSTDSSTLFKAVPVSTAAETRKETQTKLEELAVEAAAAQVEGYKGRKPEAVQADVQAAKEAARADFEPAARKQVQDSLSEGQELTEEAVNAQVDQNLEDFMTARANDAINNLREELDSEDMSIYDMYDVDPALMALYEADQAQRVEDTGVMISGWKAASTLRLQGQELIGALNTVLEPLGKHVASERKDENTVVLREVGKEVLSDSAGSTNDIKSYSVEYEVKRDGVTSYVTKPLVYNKKLYPVGKKEDLGSKGEQTIVAVNEINHNPTEYLAVSKTTPLNTIPTDTLPEVFHRVGNALTTGMLNTVAPFSKDEVNIKAGRRSDEAETAVRKTLDSPARSLLFDKEGKIKPVVGVAMGVAVGDLLKTDSQNLTLGSKPVADVARMFRVPEMDVTKAMAALANENGALAKTVANTLGTSVLRSLGISRKRDNEVNRGQYERMVSDIGNYVLAAAENQGILATKAVASNDIAKELQDGVIVGTEPLTWFVHIPSTNVSNATKTRMNSNTAAFLRDYDQITEYMPDPVNSRKEPRFGSRIPTNVQNEILSGIRNDSVGGNIPAEAKETLTNLMNTPFEMDMNNVGKFVEELKEPEVREAVKRSLGFIEISETNPEYNSLTFENKEIQKAINRDIEKSISMLENYHTDISNGLRNEMYFRFFYTSNHRYMMDSNTLNGQADKLHRFFVVPKAHNVTYEVDRSDNTFKHRYKEDGVYKKIDSSLYVRKALAQAAGIGTDKTATSEIIRVGNALLSMSVQDVDTARRELLLNGKYTVVINGQPETFKPDHLSHALQGLEFVRKYKSTDKRYFADSLSAEMDALTSGFSNKVQQFGTVSVRNAEGIAESTRSEHQRRVGIIEPGNNVAEMFEDSGIGVNDMLSNKNLLDSYKNLAKDTLLDLDSRVQMLQGRNKDIFEAIAALLPGAEQRKVDPANIEISKELRDLFKPGFMIFNYSAGINRITTNLGEAMASQMLVDIAKADFKTLDPSKRKAMEAVAALVKNGNGTMGITLEVLQERIRNQPSYSLETVIEGINKVTGRKESTTVTLERFLVDRIIKPTYGTSVDESFNRNFSEFIQIQDVTNDAFKLSYAVFSKLLEKKITAFRSATDNAPITEVELKSMIGELRKAFPVIAGPLSDALDEGIHVYDTATTTPKGAMATTTSPQMHYATGNGAKTRSMNPLIKTIIAAANSGAVLPFHALDGAQMSRMVNEFTRRYVNKFYGSGVVPIHDAVIPPLPFLDIIGHSYNKNTVELNQNYSILGEIQKMAGRAKAILDGSDTELSVDIDSIDPVLSLSFISKKALAENKEDIKAVKSMVKSLETNKASVSQIAEAKEELLNLENMFSFKSTFGSVNRTLDKWVERVDIERATMFPDGTKVGVLVGTPGTVVTTGIAEPDLSYLDKLAGQYETVVIGTPAVAEEVKAGVLGDRFAGVSLDMDARASTANAVMYLKPKGLPKNAPLDKASKGIRIGTNINADANSSIMVIVADKMANGSVLTEAEVAAVETAWSQTIKAGNSALKKGSTLVFSSEAVLTEDLGDDATIGESYVFQRLTQGKDYSVTPVRVGNTTMYNVKKAPKDTSNSTLNDVQQGGMMAEFDTVTKRNRLKETVTKFKNLTKDCK